MVGVDVRPVRCGLFVVHPGEGAAGGVLDQRRGLPVDPVGALLEERVAEVDVGEFGEAEGRCDPVVGLVHPCRRPAQVVFQPEQGTSVPGVEPDPQGAPAGRQAHLVNQGGVTGHPEGDVPLGAPLGLGRVGIQGAVHVQEQQRSLHGPDLSRRGRRFPARGRGAGDARHSASAIAVLVSISVVVVRSSTRGVGGTGTAPAPAPTAQQDLTRITRRGAHSRRCFSRVAPSPGGTAPATPFTQARSCNSPRPTAADIP